MDFSIEKVVDSVIEMSKIIGTDYKTIWEKYTHELITSQFTWEEIEEELNMKTMYDGNNINDICFKLACFYMTITELFDRALTDERSKNDPTEAFVDSNLTIKNLSKENAFFTYKTLSKIAESKFKIPPHIFYKNLKKQIKINKFSAQGWINQYNFLYENGEMDFIRRCL